MNENDLRRSDALFLPRETLLERADQLGTPFYLYDERGLLENIRLLRSAFSWAAGYRQFYPLRLSPQPEVLRILCRAGSGVSCCTLPELRLARQCGFSGDQIVYTPVCPDEEAMRLTLGLGASLQLDSVEAAEQAIRWRLLPETVCLLCTPWDRPKSYRLGEAVQARSKQGMSCDQVRTLAPALLRAGVKRLGLGLGLSMQSMDVRHFARKTGILAELARSLRRKDIRISFLDLGDGYNLSCTPDTKLPELQAVGACTREAAAALEEEMHIWTGIGRRMTASCGILVARVLSIRQAVRGFLVLDATAYQMPRVLRGAYHHVSLPGSEERQKRRYWDVVGFLPDDDDRFAERRMLPTAAPGDLCVIHDAAFCAGASQIPYGGIRPCDEYLYTADGDFLPLSGGSSMQKRACPVERTASESND